MSGEVCHLPCVHVLCLSPGMAHIFPLPAERFSGTMKCHNKWSSMKIFAQKNVWCFVPCASRFLAPKMGVILAIYSQNTSKNLAILCQCEYASPDNLWQLMGTAWAWQYRRIRRDMFSEGIYDNLVIIGANFRDFKVIVGRINWSYFSRLFLVSAPTNCDQ